MYIKGVARFFSRYKSFVKKVDAATTDNYCLRLFCTREKFLIVTDLTFSARNGPFSCAVFLLLLTKFITKDPALTSNQHLYKKGKRKKTVDDP